MLEKRDLKKTSFTFSRGLQPRVREQKSATESRRYRSNLDKCQGYCRDLITTLGKRIANDCSAQTKELKLREDNSDPIGIHPELNATTSTQIHLIARVGFRPSS